MKIETFHNLKIKIFHIKNKNEILSVVDSLNWNQTNCIKITKANEDTIDVFGSLNVGLFCYYKNYNAIINPLNVNDIKKMLIDWC
jgi:hypothetical protein